MKLIIKYCLTVILVIYVQTSFALNTENMDMAKRVVLVMQADMKTAEAGLLNDALQSYLGSNWQMIFSSALDGVDPVVEVSKRLDVYEKIEHDLPELRHRMLSNGELTSDFDNALAQFFSANFTLAELVELESFYKTPAGKKLVRLAPKMANSFAPVFEKWFPIWDEQLKQEVLIRLKLKKQ